MRALFFVHLVKYLFIKKTELFLMYYLHLQDLFNVYYLHLLSCMQGKYAIFAHFCIRKYAKKHYSEIKTVRVQILHFQHLYKVQKHMIKC